MPALNINPHCRVRAGRTCTFASPLTVGAFIFQNFRAHFRRNLRRSLIVHLPSCAASGVPFS